MANSNRFLVLLLPFLIFPVHAAPASSLRYHSAAIFASVLTPDVVKLQRIIENVLDSRIPNFSVASNDTGLLVQRAALACSISQLIFEETPELADVRYIDSASVEDYWRRIQVNW